MTIKETGRKAMANRGEQEARECYKKWTGDAIKIS